jgi:hypothetical protein
MSLERQEIGSRVPFVTTRAEEPWPRPTVVGRDNGPTGSAWATCREVTHGYPHCEPSPKSCGKLRDAIREETAQSTLWKNPEEIIKCVNRRVRGWIGYFHYANIGHLKPLIPSVSPYSTHLLPFLSQSLRCESRLNSYFVARVFMTIIDQRTG